jgi:hypothetical protein
MKPVVRRSLAAPFGALALLCLSCGNVVIDHSPSGNLLDPDTAGFEHTLGAWTTWFSASISRATDSFQVPPASMRVDLTAEFWGLQQSNWPGFPASPGAHDVEFWSRLSSGAPTTLELDVLWGDESGNDFGTQTVTAPALTGAWQHAQATLTAPAGVTRVQLRLQGQGNTGDAFEVDDFFIGSAH